ncbi:MspA protein [Mycobacterium sp. PS03-16]|uniref:MspA family porin n=1 Tax=Mycobacterium sp. PS03-16 TaxID=2559611 RepID=UPI0010732E34|nr:MspA family porin [Mycobacterium sp. PS03-16]TFV56986.1 MspA protein [Mycobacterium sp. PS03-16]
MVGAALPVTASAQPDVEPVVADAPAPGAVPPPPPLPDGAVVSTPPVTTDTPDGWTLTLSARDETQAVSNPLTTALSSREYVVGGTFAGELTGPEGQEPPRGVLEVGYEIGCGIDMSTSNGVSLTGTAGFNPNIGIIGTDVISPLPDGIGPVIGGNIGGGITIGLKPGFVNVVQVTEKEFTGAAPWVKVTNFRVNIDGCVGQSFIRSYALLTHTTDMSEAVLAWYGTTKVV